MAALNVGDLREALNKYPDHLRVEIYSHGDGQYDELFSGISNITLMRAHVDHDGDEDYLLVLTNLYRIPTPLTGVV